jgi:hypothetical protein
MVEGGVNHITDVRCPTIAPTAVHLGETNTEEERLEDDIAHDIRAFTQVVNIVLELL